MRAGGDGIASGLLERMSADAWFGRLEIGVRRVLLAAARPRSLNPGEFAFRQGDAYDGLLGVVSGMLKASTLREDGREAILAVLEPGNWFGETSSVDHEPRRHDVVATEPTELLHVAQRDLDALLQRADIAREVLRLASMHLRIAFDMIEDATLRSTRARVARRLRQLASGDAVPRPTQRQAVTVTQESLAMMLGITRQTLALELKALAAAGAISIRYGRIDIQSPARLRGFEDATLRSTRARVARRLRQLASGDAVPRPTQRQAVTVTQESLAMMLGITRQTLALELKALAAAGAISIRYGRIDIQSPARLRGFEDEA